MYYCHNYLYEVPEIFCPALFGLQIHRNALANICTCKLIVTPFITLKCNFPTMRVLSLPFPQPTPAFSSSPPPLFVHVQTSFFLQLSSLNSASGGLFIMFIHTDLEPSSFLAPFQAYFIFHHARQEGADKRQARLLTCCVRGKGASRHGRESEAAQKGPSVLLVAKSYGWHFRSRFTFYCHLPSTLFRLRTRLDLLDGL